MTSDLSVVAEVVEGGTPEWVRVDEPAFPTEAHQDLYRRYVAEMESQSNPTGARVISIAIRELARDHVVSLIADQGTTKARNLERDRRKSAMLKQIVEADKRSRAGAVDGVRFATALVAEIMLALDSDLGHDPVLVTKVKESVGASILVFTQEYVKELR